MKNVSQRLFSVCLFFTFIPDVVCAEEEDEDEGDDEDFEEDGRTSSKGVMQLGTLMLVVDILF